MKKKKKIFSFFLKDYLAFCPLLRLWRKGDQDYTAYLLDSNEKAAWRLGVGFGL
jgi:hypothetical protein